MSSCSLYVMRYFKRRRKAREETQTVNKSDADVLLPRFRAEQESGGCLVSNAASLEGNGSKPGDTGPTRCLPTAGTSTKSALLFPRCAVCVTQKLQPTLTRSAQAESLHAGEEDQAGV